jgi:hypothetical protein
VIAQSSSVSLTLSALTKAAAKIGNPHPAEEICYVESHIYRKLGYVDPAGLSIYPEKV